METVRIITLHLAYGGIEKAVCQMASMFAEKYDVEIPSEELENLNTIADVIKYIEAHK